MCDWCKTEDFYECGCHECENAVTHCYPCNHDIDVKNYYKRDSNGFPLRDEEPLFTEESVFN